VLVLKPEQLILLLMTLAINLIALVLEPVSLCLSVQDLLLHFHLVQVLVSGLLQFSVVGMDVVHLSLEPIEEVFPVHIHIVLHLPCQHVDALVHLREVLIDLILGCHIVVELLLCPHLELLQVYEVPL
jgi:hypothetical protein